MLLLNYNFFVIIDFLKWIKLNSFIKITSYANFVDLNRSLFFVFKYYLAWFFRYNRISFDIAFRFFFLFFFFPYRLRIINFLIGRSILQGPDSLLRFVCHRTFDVGRLISTSIDFKRLYIGFSFFFFLDEYANVNEKRDV